MSLKLWMPLIRDSHNQGLSDVSPAEYGVQYQTGGVIGGCAYFNAGSNTYINTKFNTNIGTSDFSLALWVKIPTKTSGSYFVVASSKTNSASSAGLGIYWNHTQKKFLWSTANGSTYQEIWMSTAVDNLVYDKWCHVIMVRDSSDPKHGYFYINGTRYDLASTPSILNITTATPLYMARTTNGSYILQMYANDLRFYDHALSPKEAKELSKGLTCHYPMNQNGTEDNSDGILYDVSGYNNHMIDHVDVSRNRYLTYVTDSPRYSKATHYVWPVWNQSKQTVSTGRFFPYTNITVNFWMRYQQGEWSNPISCTEGGGWNFEDLNGGIQFSINITGVSYKHANSGVTRGNLDGNWHMFTGIYDSAAQKTKIYVDGVLKEETATGTSAAIYYANCPFCIGGEADATACNPAFTGDLSDIRIYGTALSDADILELYNTPMSITNKGSVVTRGEFIES